MDEIKDLKQSINDLINDQNRLQKKYDTIKRKRCKKNYGKTRINKRGI